MAKDELEISFLGETLRLHKERVVFWKEHEVLLLADLHLGKAQHFRKAGIPIPKGVSKHNFDRIQGVIDHFQPKRVLILGDLFHSVYNPVWDEFGDFTQQQNCTFELVIGNHDILDQTQYDRFNILCHGEALREGPFIFTHDPAEELGISAPEYNLSGHLHPGVLLHGQGKQTIKLPCFYFGKAGGILPAFGQFTGLAVLQPKRGERVFVVTPESVLEV